MTAEKVWGIECSRCEEPKLIYRKLSLTNPSGELLDSASYCRDCWDDIRVSVRDASGLKEEGIWR